jgi:hypothetical protein
MFLKGVGALNVEPCLESRGGVVIQAGTSKAEPGRPTPGS